MKSFVNVAPEFPPPPYSWLITTDGVETDTVCCAERGESGEDKAGDVGRSVQERILVPNKRLIAARTTWCRMSADFLLDILGCSMLAFGLLGSAAIESNQKR
jgi:hypothetical protein